MRFDVSSLLRLPIWNPVYLKALTRRKPGLAKGESIPRIARHQSRTVVDGDWLETFFALCPSEHHDFLPVTVPHLLSFTRHLENMVDRNFPLPLLGIVHTKSVITQYRRIAADEALSYECVIEGQRRAPKGIEFDLVTRADSQGTRVWESVATMLYLERKKSGGKKQSKRHTVEIPEGSQSVRWSLASDLGRRYALLSGDLNPIHLSDLTARLFGFRHAIVHGMWTMARIGTALEAKWGEGPRVFTCEFRRPIELPAQVVFHQLETEAEQISFWLTSGDGQTCYVKGTLASAT